MNRGTFGPGSSEGPWPFRRHLILGRGGPKPKPNFPFPLSGLRFGFNPADLLLIEPWPRPRSIPILEPTLPSIIFYGFLQSVQLFLRTSKLLLQPKQGQLSLTFHCADIGQTTCTSIRFKGSTIPYCKRTLPNYCVLFQQRTRTSMHCHPTI